MKITGNLLKPMFKKLIRVPLDLGTNFLTFIRSYVSPVLGDYAFAHKVTDVDEFTLSPGDLVVDREIFEYAEKHGDTPKDNQETEFILGSVVGFNLKRMTVTVSYFNPAEPTRPIIKEYKEDDLKLLKSPITELAFQYRLLKATEEIEQSLKNHDISSENLLQGLETVKTIQTSSDDDEEIIH
jgi:hypothetical protein